MTAVRVALAIIWHQGRLFVQRRSLTARVLPGLWEFPGGKVAALETPEEGLLRELREEISYRPEALTPLPAFVYAYPEREVELHPFLCRGGSAPRTALAWGWFAFPEWAALPMPEANRQWLPDLHKILFISKMEREI